MSSNGISRSSAINTRTIRKIEAPRPLKNSSTSESHFKTSYLSLALTSFPIDSVEKLISLMDMVVNNMLHNEDSRNTNSDNISLITTNIIHLCKHLKIFGPQLENSVYQGQLDRAFLAFREGLIYGSLEYEARTHLLEIIELRTCQWNPRKVLSPIENDINNLVEVTDLKSRTRYCPLMSVDSTSNLLPEEILRRSSKHRDNPSKSGLKHFLKEEIIIKNSDSGKVMGIKGRRVHMIEQLSKTIISFQRVSPNAKERMVQITGPNEETVSYATKLIENTIRNNSSPVKEMYGLESDSSSEESFNNSLDCRSYRGNEELMKDAFTSNTFVTSFPKWKMNLNRSVELYQYKHKVIVRNCHLTITGDDYTYVTVAKAILDDYFSKLRNSDSVHEDNSSNDGLLDNSSPKNEEYDKLLQRGTSRDIKSDELSPFLNTDLSNISANTSVTDPDLGDNISSVIHSFELNDCSSDTKVMSIPSSKDMMSAIVKTDAVDNHGCLADVISVPLDCSTKFDENRNIYTTEFLKQHRTSELSRRKPQDWEMISTKFPDIIKDNEDTLE